MFDQLKGMAGIAGLMKDLPRIKAELEAVKVRLADRTASAETGGGAVRATANGLQKIVGLEIDPAMMATFVNAENPDDQALAADLVMGAVNTALDKARAMAEEEFANAAQDLGLPIPPGGLGGLMS